MPTCSPKDKPMKLQKQQANKPPILQNFYIPNPSDEGVNDAVAVHPMNSTTTAKETFRAIDEYIRKMLFSSKNQYQWYINKLQHHEI